jgi:hypothetical protein
MTDRYRPLDGTTIMLDIALSRKVTTPGQGDVMSHFAKRIAIAFVVAALAIPMTAAAASADGGGSANAGPRCCL